MKVDLDCTKKKINGKIIKEIMKGKASYVNPDNKSKSTDLIGQIGDNQVGGFSFDKTFLNLRATFQILFLDTNDTGI